MAVAQQLLGGETAPRFSTGGGSRDDRRWARFPRRPPGEIQCFTSGGRLVRSDFPMKKVNTREVKEETWTSPKGKFASNDREISRALGRVPTSTDLNLRHPFDVEICRIPPGKAVCPYHSHSAQWEFYHVIEGSGQVRDESGLTDIEPGDAFLFRPDEPHQIINHSQADLILYLVADNPLGETCYYPDSKKWLVRSPERRLLRSEPLEYLDGEE